MISRPQFARRVAASALLLSAACLAGCVAVARDLPVAKGRMEPVARSDGYQWTGLAISRSGRMFASFPRWNEPFASSVVELRRDGAWAPFPNEAWNRWNPADTAGAPSHWVCVQSVYIDRGDRLWVLDPGSPRMQGVIRGGAKLVQFDLTNDRAQRTIIFDEQAAPAGSYLNDVRIDTARDFAYITDSGLGAIVVIDLRTNVARRLLGGHYSTQAEPIDLTVEGRALVKGDGTPLRVHADGIALDAQGDYLYYQALTGRTLYRVPTSVLRDPTLEPYQVANAVQRLGATVATDGMEIDDAGNVYFTAFERDAIVARRPDGTLVDVAVDPRLSWPDTLAFGPQGYLYVTTAQINRTPWFKGNLSMPASPYYILKTAPLGKAVPTTADPG
ncbi:MAG: SMP-30/gluconolactonase/LRE family protein [Phycisphaerae bacterium]|nr:SMP-30/gluconolactonase/LRE family protein [Phycisphaerae bacterium]